MLTRLGRARLALEELDEAVATLRQAVADHPEHAAAYLELGVVWRRIGNDAEAAEAYRAARTRFARGGENWWRATIGLALSLADHDGPERAGDILRAAAALYPPTNSPTLEQRIRDTQRQLDDLID